MSKNTWFVGSMILLTFGTFIIVREQGWWNWNNGGIFKPNINFAEISGYVLIFTGIVMGAYSSDIGRWHKRATLILGIIFLLVLFYRAIPLYLAQ